MTEAKLIAAEHARRRAIETSDFDALERLVADPFHYAHINGMVEDRASYFARTRANPHNISATSAHDINVTLRPGYAMMSGRSVIAAASNDPHAIIETLFLSVWEQSNDGWQITAYASTPLPGQWRG